MLAHAKLDVYRCSIEFLALSARIGEAVPLYWSTGNSILLEQLKRAALSIPLNIAEGVGKQGIQDVEMSRGDNSFTSTSTECDGHLRVPNTEKWVLSSESTSTLKAAARAELRCAWHSITAWKPHPAVQGSQGESCGG